MARRHAMQPERVHRATSSSATHRLQSQKRIADILSAYDDLIENNRRRMALLEEAARQLYREWFVRLRFPGHEHTRITNGVPEGWRKVPLARVTTKIGSGFDAAWRRIRLSDRRDSADPQPERVRRPLRGLRACVFMSDEHAAALAKRDRRVAGHSAQHHGRVRGALLHGTRALSPGQSQPARDDRSRRSRNRRTHSLFTRPSTATSGSDSL